MLSPEGQEEQCAGTQVQGRTEAVDAGRREAEQRRARAVSCLFQVAFRSQIQLSLPFFFL